jgi:hypothetical protein
MKIKGHKEYSQNMEYHIDDAQQFILYIKLLATNKMDEIKHD